MSAASNAPIIVKRRRKDSATHHHGGAWKVAYADFVTAMMAFFLLMWLLGATNENQRKGIADYFNPTIPVNKVSGGGDGAFGGDSVFTESTLAHNGVGASMAYVSDGHESSGDTGVEKDQADASARDEAVFAEITDRLSGKGGESYVTDLLARHVITRLSDEGLIVEIFDAPGTPLFNAANQPTRTLDSLLASVAEVFRLADNPVAIQAHTASVPVVVRSNPVWETSSDRANQVRARLVEQGLRSNRMQRVTGFADRIPVTRDPLAPRNNRIEIILLRTEL